MKNFLGLAIFGLVAAGIGAAATMFAIKKREELDAYDDFDDEFCDDCGFAIPAPTEMIPATKEEEVSFPFLIPVIVAAVIAIGGAVVIAAKKKK